ncbi:MAG: hypothetical protein IJG13_10270 [Kiritimatiellae bacterium]|nr:hypothetical protein [Kiritimatiellia bacterium]MBQ3341465.1 hypothetical protein [Kiritimatiellia bacterium]
MKLLTGRKFPRVMNSVFVACLALSAHGAPNVFDDAVFWFRGGKDKNGDGYMITGEFFDDLQANDNSHDNHKMPLSSSRYTGDSTAFRGNAVIQNEQVVFPALGTSVMKEMRVLHISDDIQGGKYYFPFDVNPRSVFARYNISNEYTIVSRIRLDDDSFNRKICFLRLGYDGTTRQGMWLGFAKRDPSSAKYRCITGSCTPNSSGVDSAFDMDLRIPTNTWVDIAVVVGNGKLRVGIAAPESLSNCNNNPTIAFDETDMWTDNCTLLEDGKYRFFCVNGQTTYAQASGTDQTAFIGSVQQMAIWGRALSDQEVMSAFGMPRPAIFRTGFDNGDSNEFGGTRSGSSQTIDGLGSWQNIANTMQAGDTWTVNFNALRDEAGLPQIFSIKSLRGSPAQIEVTLTNATHNTFLGENRVSPNGRTFWPVPKDLITEGANALIIRRKDGGAGTFKMDAMELGGSLGVGKITASSTDDGRVNPELISTGVSSAADPNTQHWPTKLDPSTGVIDLHFRVWVDPDVADKVSFNFKTAVLCDTTGSEHFEVRINNARKTQVNAFATWKQYTFNPGKLRGGWNDFDFISTDSHCWEFGYFRFETTLPEAFGFPPPPGMRIIVK